MDNTLCHHGIKGQKWGVRRYQNPDGSLTNAGRKKYGTKTNFERVQAAKKAATIGVKKRKAMEKANARTAKEIAKYEKKAGLNKSESKSVVKSNSKPKTINEMTNEEIQERIDRINLENKLISLTPQKVSVGQRFVNGVKGAAISIAKEKGTKIVGDYIDKQVREKLGIKDEKSMSKILQEKAQDYENRQKIDKGQKYFKEGKYAEKKNTDSDNSDNDNSKNTSKSNTDNNSNNSTNNNSQKTERWSGTVEGKGASRYTEKESKIFDTDYKESTSDNSRKTERWSGTVEGKGTSRYTKKESPIFDADYKKMNSEKINNGRKYINQLLPLLEDKKGRWLIDAK